MRPTDPPRYAIPVRLIKRHSIFTIFQQSSTCARSRASIAASTPLKFPQSRIDYISVSVFDRTSRFMPRILFQEISTKRLWQKIGTLPHHYVNYVTCNKSRMIVIYAYPRNWFYIFFNFFLNFFVTKQVQACFLDFVKFRINLDRLFYKRCSSWLL